MNYINEQFSSIPFIQSIAENPRWTVSTNQKMPIDMNLLKNEGKIAGATFKNGNNPLVTLAELINILPNASNTAYNLNQSLDDFVILDIEPKCPEDLRDKLLTLPYDYCELSLSGRGFHLGFKKPKTQHMDILLAKPAIKEEHGWYEILLNHYVTFTGKVCQPSADCVFRPIEDFYEIFDKLASEATIQHTRTVDTDDLPDVDDIEKSEEIISLLVQAKYPKTLEDFSYDNSKYEFGVAGFYYKKLNMLLDTTKFKDHEYTPQEKMILLYEIIEEIIPEREKHNTVREGLPWLLYTCKRVISTGKQ